MELDKLEQILVMEGDQEMSDKTKDRMYDKFGYREWYMMTGHKSQSTGLVPKTVINLYYDKMVAKTRRVGLDGGIVYKDLYQKKPEYRM